jgi:hypothetical protein
MTDPQGNATKQVDAQESKRLQYVAQHPLIYWAAELPVYRTPAGKPNHAVNMLVMAAVAAIDIYDDPTRVLEGRDARLNGHHSRRSLLATVRIAVTAGLLRRDGDALYPVRDSFTERRLRRAEREARERRCAARRGAVQC